MMVAFCSNSEYVAITLSSFGWSSCVSVPGPSMGWHMGPSMTCQVGFYTSSMPDKICHFSVTAAAP